MWSVFTHMKQRFPFFNKSFLACTSRATLHLSHQWSPSLKKTHFLPLPFNGWPLLPPFFNFLFSLWTDDEFNTKDEPVYRVWHGLLNPKSFLPSTAVCHGITHASRAFNSVLIKSRILVKFQLFSLLFLLITKLSSFGSFSSIIGHNNNP